MRVNDSHPRLAVEVGIGYVNHKVLFKGASLN